jgi:hypothetical protein
MLKNRNFFFIKGNINEILEFYNGIKFWPKNILQHLGLEL